MKCLQIIHKTHMIAIDHKTKILLSRLCAARNEQPYDTITVETGFQKRKNIYKLNVISLENTGCHNKIHWWLSGTQDLLNPGLIIHILLQITK